MPPLWGHLDAESSRIIGGPPVARGTSEAAPDSTLARRSNTTDATGRQQVAVNDTVVFQHPTMACPTLTPEDRIIHCLRALTKAIQADVTWDSCHEQLLAIESLRAIFTPCEMTPTAILAVNGALPVGPPPRVDMPLQQVVETTPPVPTPPTRVTPVGPRFGSSTTDQPIAQRTRRCIANANALAVSFALPPNHIDKCSKAYRAGVVSPDTSYTKPQWSTVPNH